jgi:hypothetical protein
VFFEHATAELATLTNTFKVLGVNTDPTTITLVVTDPTGVQTTYTFALGQITKTATGIYTKDIACTVDGVWSYVWIGTGTASDVVAGTFTVFNTDLNRNYCTLEELKSRLGLAQANTTNDFEMRLAVESASREIDQYCDRQFWRGTDTRTYVPCDLYRVDIDDLVSVTTLKTDASGDGTFETTWTTSDYQLLPLNAASTVESLPYTRLRAVGTLLFPLPYGLLVRSDRVQIVGVFGWPQIPAAVKQACLILAARTLKMKDVPFANAGFDGFGIARVGTKREALDLLNPYRRYPVLVA